MADPARRPSPVRLTVAEYDALIAATVAHEGMHMDDESAERAREAAALQRALQKITATMTTPATTRRRPR